MNVQGAKKISQTLLIGFICVIALLAVLIVPASSAETGKSIKIVCAFGTEPVEDMYWKVYRVGEKDQYGNFKLTGQYANYPISFSELTTEGIRGSAVALRNYLVRDGIEPDSTGYTKANGDVEFGELENGLYLAFGENLKNGAYLYKPVPIFFEVLPESEAEQTLFPKVYGDATLAGEIRSFSVKKVWDDANDSYFARPESIEVDIMRGTELYKTVTLNEGKKWSYSWQTDDLTSDWYVVERSIIQKYEVRIENNTTQFLITNKYNPNLIVGGGSFTVTTTTTTSATATASDSTTVTAAETSTAASGESSTDTTTSASTVNTTSVSAVTASTSSGTALTTTQTKSAAVQTTATTTAAEKAPQTGQLWWLVPVLAAGGMLLIGAGLTLRKKNDEE